LFFFEKIELVHTDLKLENILFTIKSQSNQPPSHNQRSHPPSHNLPSHNQPSQERRNNNHHFIQQTYTRSQLINQFLKNDLFFHSVIFSSSREIFFEKEEDQEDQKLNKFQDWIQKQINKFDKKSTTKSKNSSSSSSSRRRRNDNNQEKKKNKFQFLFPSHCSIKS